MAWVLMVQPAFQPALQGKELLQTIFKRKQPPSVKDPSVETLAAEIDWLEKHIDNYGTVVPKQPDVWGQARLTKHRQEFEKVMYKELGNFNLLINGTISRSDSAFLANAFALSAAVSGQQPTSVTTTTTSAPGSGNFIAAPTINSSQFAGFTQQGIALEPTIALDQRARYLNHLHELRRMNEGDDTSVSPGYALNLVRIPISAISGRSTRKGYGAEITLTASLNLTPSLLPTTFRSLVINDVVDQLGLPITQIADQKLWIPSAEEKKKQEQVKSDINAGIKTAQARVAAVAAQTNAANVLAKAIPAADSEPAVSTSTLTKHPSNAVRTFAQKLELPDVATIPVLEEKLASAKRDESLEASLDLAATKLKLDAAQSQATNVLAAASSVPGELPEPVKMALSELKNALDQSNVVEPAQTMLRN